MEKQLLSTILASRESFSLIDQYINRKLYSREFGILYDFIVGYYGRDLDARFVDTSVLRELIGTEIVNEKHRDRFIKILEESIATEASSENVKDVILGMKRNELGMMLATAISNGDDHDELLEEYQQLLRFSSLDEMLERGVEVFDNADVDGLLEAAGNRTGLLCVYPLSLNDRLDGGVTGADHMIIIARPEMGKTALIVTMACGFAKQGKRGIIFNNEERIDRLRLRALSCCTGMTKLEMLADPERAKRLANENGFHNIIFVGLSPGTPRQIEAFIERYEPEWIIVDQLRNLIVKSENRTTQLEAAAQTIRNLAKKWNIFAASVTQAGDSAEGNSVLNMGDVDSSNTGIPGACDVLLGVGATEEQKKANIRVLSLSKNKLGGIHDDWPVRFNQWISKYVSIQDKVQQ